RAGASLLCVDEPAQHALDLRVEALRERVRLVQATAVDPYHDLRARRLERRALQPLDRLAPDLAIQMPRPRASIQPCARRLVRSAARADPKPAAPGRTQRRERDR